MLVKTDVIPCVVIISYIRFQMCVVSRNSRGRILKSYYNMFSGELGTGVDINRTLLSPEDKLKYDEYYKKHHLNIYASDLISVHRTLNPDIIDPWLVYVYYISTENL